MVDQYRGDLSPRAIREEPRELGRRRSLVGEPIEWKEPVPTRRRVAGVLSAALRAIRLPGSSAVGNTDFYQTEGGTQVALSDSSYGMKGVEYALPGLGGLSDEGIQVILEHDMATSQAREKLLTTLKRTHPKK